MNKINKLMLANLAVGLALSTAIHADDEKTPLWTYSAPSPAQVVVSIGGMATIQYTVTNHSSKTKNLLLKETPGLSATSCYLPGRDSTCTLTLSINGSMISEQGLHAGPVLCEQSNPSQCYQPNAANLLNVNKNTTDASLQVSTDELALKAGGNARIITITNTGALNATNVTYTLSPALPSDATINPADCATILPNTTCVLTVTPGTTPTAVPGDLTPMAVTVNIKGNNTNTVSSAINIITYGSVYQGGYVFAMDDNVLPSQSINGKVLAKTYQAKRYPGGIVWGGFGIAVGGIAQNSTAGLNSCSGAYDGKCNTGRIIERLTDQSPNLPLPSYAAGLCKAEIDGYTDWYLPAICEMGPASNSSNCAVDTENMVNNLPDLLGIGSVNPDDDPDSTCAYASTYSGTICLAGYYRSSTEYSLNQSQAAWDQYFSSSNLQDYYSKNDQSGVRCVRSF